MSTDRDVVISGIGVVSPIGIGVDAFWEHLSQRKSGLHRISLYKHFAAPDNVGGEVRDFTEEAARKTWLSKLKKSVKVMCREIQQGVASAFIALDNSALNLEAMDHDRLGVEFGANLMLSPPEVLAGACRASSEMDHKPPLFHAENWGQQGMPQLEPLWLLKYLPNMPACHIGIVADARGPNNSLTMEDASGGMAIGEALRILQRGAADVMITGSTGTTMHAIKTMHIALWPEMLAKTPAEPERRARPFDLNRDGMVVAEGAATLILENHAHAEKRGAQIWGRILGTGSSCVVDPNGKANSRQALRQAMQAAFRAAGLTPAAVGHINAHGVGLPKTDIAEAEAIHDVFGPLAETVPVTAPKSFLGNSGAASAILELAASLVALKHGVIPATLNYETPDPACRLNIVTQLQPTTNKVVLSLNITRKGQATAILAEGA